MGRLIEEISLCIDKKKKNYTIKEQRQLEDKPRGFNWQIEEAQLPIHSTNIYSIVYLLCKDGALG